MQTEHHTTRNAPRHLSTEELAAALCVRPQTVRAGLCRDGHYMKLRPQKLPNGRLLWDSHDLHCLIAGEPPAPSQEAEGGK